MSPHSQKYQYLQWNIWYSMNMHVYFNSILCLLLLRTNFRISDGLTNCSPWASSMLKLFSLESLTANPSRSCFSDSKEFLNSGMNGWGCVFNLSSAQSWSSSARIWFLCKLFFRLQRKKFCMNLNEMKYFVSELEFFQNHYWVSSWVQLNLQVWCLVWFLWGKT